MSETYIGGDTNRRFKTYEYIAKMSDRVPRTTQQLADELARNYQITLWHMITMHDLKLIHIHDWVRDESDPNSKYRPQFKFGRGRDAPRKRVTNAESLRKRREKKKRLAEEAAAAMMVVRDPFADMVRLHLRATAVLEEVPATA